MSNSSKLSYTQLSSVQVSKSKNLVISACSAGGFTLAQQFVSIDLDTGERQAVFLKGACQIKDLDALKGLAEAVESAIAKSEELEDEQEAGEAIAWDR